MRVGLAFLTIAAGSLAAAAWLPGMLADGELAVVTEVGNGGVARVAVPAPDRPAPDDGATDAGAPRFFGFAFPGLSSERPKADLQSPSQSPVPREVVRTVDVPPAAVIAPQPRPAVRPVADVAATVLTPPPAHAVPREVPRHELVRDLQRELKRVGCYAGDVDGNWGPGSRRAAQAFMTRLNSSMPTEEPDFIQLTLVRGFTGSACAASCPPNQSAAGYGRCHPALVTAARPAVRPIEERNTALQPASTVVTGAIPATAVPTPQVVRSSVAQSGTAPAVPANEVAAMPPVVTPLDGRMTVGGPQQPPSADLAPATTGFDARQVRSRPAPPPRQQSVRRQDRSWTGSFFNN